MREKSGGGQTESNGREVYQAWENWRVAPVRATPRLQKIVTAVLRGAAILAAFLACRQDASATGFLTMSCDSQ